MSWTATASDIDRIWNWTFPRALAMEWGKVLNKYDQTLNSLYADTTSIPPENPFVTQKLKDFITTHDTKSVADVTAIEAQIPGWRHVEIWRARATFTPPTIPIILDSRAPGECLQFDFMLSNVGILLPNPVKPTDTKDVFYEYLLTIPNMGLPSVPGFMGVLADYYRSASLVEAKSGNPPIDPMEKARLYLQNLTGKNIDWMIRGSHLGALVQVIPLVIAQSWTIDQSTKLPEATYLDLIRKRIHADVAPQKLKVHPPGNPKIEIEVKEDAIYIPQPAPPADISALYKLWAMGESRIPTFSTQGSPCK